MKDGGVITTPMWQRKNIGITYDFIVSGGMSSLGGVQMRSELDTIDFEATAGDTSIKIQFGDVKMTQLSLPDPQKGI